MPAILNRLSILFTHYNCVILTTQKYI